MTKKVFTIISRLNIGGPTKLVNYLHENLHQYDFESVLISGYPLDDEGEIKPLSNNENHLYIKGLTPGASSLQTFIATFKVYSLIKKHRPHIIHTHQAKAGLIGRLAGFLARTPVRIHTFHGHVFSHYFSTFKTMLIIKIEQALAKITTKLIAISPVIEKALTQDYQITTKKKVIIQPIGINTKPFQMNTSKAVCRSKLELPTNKIIIGFVGRLAPVKNPELFIQLAQVLLKKNQDIHFLIIGDGPLKNSIKSTITSSHIKNSFTLLPWQSELLNVYRSLDLLVLTSKNEGTPLTILEAMSSQTPTASTPVGGVTDLIIDMKTGILLKNSLEQMADTILSTLSNKSLLDAIILNSSQLVQENYTVEHYLKNTADIYNRLIEEFNNS